MDRKEWNNKIKKLEEYILKEFPNGCSKLRSADCDKCILSDAEFCGSKHYMCNLIGEIGHEHEDT